MSHASRYPELLAEGAYTQLARLLQLRFAARDLRLAPPRQSKASLSGPVRARSRGRGMEFEEVRVYQAGDDIRTIDWRVTARTQVAHTKLFREEKERPVLLVVDQRSSLFFGSQRCFKSVLAAHLASLLGWAALNGGDRVGGLIFGDHQHRDTRPRRNKRAVLELIHHLDDFNHRLHSPLPAQQGLPLITLLEDTRRLARPGTAVYLISDFYDFTPACEKQLYLLARHCQVNLLHLTDPLEQQLPQAGQLSVSNGHQRLVLPAGDRHAQAQWQAHYRQRLDNLKQRCQQLQVALHSFSTADDELAQLRLIYRRR